MDKSVPETLEPCPQCQAKLFSVHVQADVVVRLDAEPSRGGPFYFIDRSRNLAVEDPYGYTTRPRYRRHRCAPPVPPLSLLLARAS